MAAPTDAADPSAAAPNPSAAPAVSLSTPFLYQNQATGQPSATPLAARQLVRILCPAAKSAATSLITPRTLLIGYDPTTGAYDSLGWRSANSIPLLREACASWYYEGEGGVKGPVSARELAGLLGGKGDGDSISEKTRVFPADSQSGEWKPIRELAYLQLAMEALAEAKAMPTSWPANEEGEASVEQVAATTYDGGENGGGSKEMDGATQQKVHDELEAFLSSTDHLAPHAASAGGGGGESDEEEYESDGGTRYVKDSRTGNWVHEALAPKKEKKEEKKDDRSSAASSAKAAAAGAVPGTKKRKRTKAKFSAKNARNWVYVTGLPKDATEEEVAAYMSRVGVLDIDPESQKPKVKLYRHKKGENGHKGGEIKGDASICYARPESVELALQILDENLFRDGATLSVQRAKFEQHGTFDGEANKGGRRNVSEAKRKVARLAALQAVGWDEGDNGRIAGGLKGLRIVVLMHMFDPKELENDKDDVRLKRLEQEVHAECEELGPVEKITVFSKHPAGVMIVKFTQPNAASEAVAAFNGKMRGNGRKVEASYWDGVTDYTCRDAEKEEKETEKRLASFGDWLENQDLPDELKLQVEG
ncbi:hypothetical protein ACHAXT_007429 [Thalassiosira profunda]